VPTVDGKSYPIGELAARGGEIFVYSISAGQKIVVAAATAKRTRTAAPLVKVTLDNGREIFCTPDHEFMLRDGTYRAAQDLTASISLMPFNAQARKDEEMSIAHILRREQSLLQQSGYNHKVVSVEPVARRADVYCLTVPAYGNFALDAGVFV